MTKFYNAVTPVSSVVFNSGHVNCCRLLQEHKIIAHMDGIKPNVLKIKPPLVVTREDCTHIIQALDSTLTSIEQAL